MIHSLKIDHYIDDRLKEFNEQLKPNQTIVSMHSTPEYLFIQVEDKPAAHQRNLLLEEFNRNTQQKTK